MKNKWRRVCISLSEEEYKKVRILTGIRKESVSSFIRYLIKIHSSLNTSYSDIIRLIEGDDSNSAKPF